MVASSTLALIASYVALASARANPAPITTSAATPCITAEEDKITQCPDGKNHRLGGLVTSCAGKPAVADYPDFLCPGCTVEEVDQITKCGDGNMHRYGGPITHCSGQPDKTGFTGPCATVTATKVSSDESCTTEAVDKFKMCDENVKRYGGNITSCPGKPAATSFTEPPCPRGTPKPGCIVGDVTGELHCGPDPSTMLYFSGHNTWCTGETSTTSDYTIPDCPTATPTA